MGGKMTNEQMTNDKSQRPNPKPQTTLERVEAVQALAAMQLPVAEWEQMEQESEEEIAPDV
jgi:hypothetical protein